MIGLLFTPPPERRRRPSSPVYTVPWLPELERTQAWPEVSGNALLFTFMVSILWGRHPRPEEFALAVSSLMAGVSPDILRYSLRMAKELGLFESPMVPSAEEVAAARARFERERQS